MRFITEESQAGVNIRTEAKGTVRKVMIPNTNFTIWEPKGSKKQYINMLKNEIALRVGKKNKKMICHNEV